MIRNFEEMVWLDMTSEYTVDTVGTKDVVLNSTGHEKMMKKFDFVKDIWLAVSSVSRNTSPCKRHFEIIKPRASIRGNTVFAFGPRACDIKATTKKVNLKQLSVTN